MSPPTPTQVARPVFSLVLGVALAFGFSGGQSLKAEPGASVFQEKCASCHGAEGQGVADKYDDPLYGDHSLAVLTRLIERTMPEENPETCVGDEARQVAEYVYREFYSPEARQNKGLGPAPRIQLARLTVPQYRNAVADLLGHFTPAPTEGRKRRQRDEEEAPQAALEPGLRAEYFQSKGMSKADDLGLERVDRSIDFDFGEGSPAENITADQFAIIWKGTLIANDTGHYEFRVRTQNGARLYLNSDPSERLRKLRDDSSVAGQAALVDAWVSSGKMREGTARVFLLGGRQYPLRLEFFKYKEKTASVKLEWKPPHGTWAVLGHHHLTTAPAVRTYVVDTPFPPDDRSLGYERGSSISHEWQAAATNAAIAAAAEVVDRLPLLAQFDDDTPDREGLLKDFVVRFATVAYRRPLASEEDQLFRALLFDEAANSEAAVRRAVLLILESPSFLYTDLTPPGQAPSQHAIASRLSFALWDSIPDELLFEAADKGQLATAEQIEDQARRMLADPRAKAKMQGFFQHWLELEERDLAKDKDMFPEFDEAVIADLRRSLDLFLEQVVWSEESDYRQLLLADYLVLNDRLRRLYQCQEDVSEATGCASLGESVQDFERVVFAPGRRAGVLTHPYLLSAFAYHNNTSPIHRGVFLTRNVMGRALKPPPIAVAFKNDEFAPDLTMREKITQLTRDKACMACHSVINPLGYALENYDAVGRWRTSDNNKPVNSTSKYVTVEGDVLEVQSARDIAAFAVSSESSHRAFVTQMFQHLVKQNPAAYAPDTVGQLQSQFEEDDFNVQHLMAGIAVLAAGHGDTTLANSHTTPLTPEAKP